MIRDINIPVECQYLFNNLNGVVKYPNDCLRVVSDDWDINQDVKPLIGKMSEAMKKGNGIGLAAPQIGVNKRVILVHYNNNKYALVNPVIEEYSGEYLSEEGCLSIPRLTGKVKRHQNITLRGTTPHGKEKILHLTDMDAVVPQHEMDHLNGILFIDRAIPSTLCWLTAKGEIPAVLDCEE